MYKQINRVNLDDISSLKREMGLLRSFVISSLGKDKEGDYKPEFVNRILKTSSKKADYKFKSAKHFLKQLAE